jgi:DNA recombination protein RmuC
MDTQQLITSLGQITPGHMGFLAAGFVLGILVSLALARFGLFFFSRRLRDLSEQALFHNSNTFLEMAQTYFTGFVREARQDFRAKGDEIRLAVDPVHKVLEKYEQQLGMMEKQRERAYGDITRYLSQMSQTQAKLFQETGNLVKALRVPHVRGRWGETTLKRAVELAGMAEHCDFQEQVTSGAGTHLRPDMVVTLPGNRKIVIDAKVPLMAYLDALESEDEAEVKARMADHARQVGAHIRMLGSKKYTAAFSPTPEFVVLFIPGENFFSAALSLQPDLLEKGVQKGVILATPSTLIALLKTIAYSWQQQQGLENAEAIRDLGAELYSRLSGMAGHMNRIGKDIEKTAADFNRAVGTMENRVMVSARKLSNLSVSSEEMSGLESVTPEKKGTRKMRDDEKETS